VITDANLPTSVGTGPEDVVIVARRADLLLWEDGDGTPTELRFEQTLGTQLTVELVAYGYAAFTAGRYPTAVGTIGGNATIGNGLVAPTF
jgi:two-component sensor histidine kinase